MALSDMPDEHALAGIVGRRLVASWILPDTIASAWTGSSTAKRPRSPAVSRRRRSAKSRSCLAPVRATALNRASVCQGGRGRARSGATGWAPVPPAFRLVQEIWITFTKRSAFTPPTSTSLPHPENTVPRMIVQTRRAGSEQRGARTTSTSAAGETSKSAARGTCISWT